MDYVSESGHRGIWHCFPEPAGWEPDTVLVGILRVGRLHAHVPDRKEPVGDLRRHSGLSESLRKYDAQGSACPHVLLRHYSSRESTEQIVSGVVKDRIR